MPCQTALPGAAPAPAGLRAPAPLRSAGCRSRTRPLRESFRRPQTQTPTQGRGGGCSLGSGADSGAGPGSGQSRRQAPRRPFLPPLPPSSSRLPAAYLSGQGRQHPRLPAQRRPGRTRLRHRRRSAARRPQRSAASGPAHPRYRSGGGAAPPGSAEPLQPARPHLRAGRARGALGAGRYRRPGGAGPAPCAAAGSAAAPAPAPRGGHAARGALGKKCRRLLPPAPAAAPAANRPRAALFGPRPAQARGLTGVTAPPGLGARLGT